MGDYACAELLTAGYQNVVGMPPFRSSLASRIILCPPASEEKPKLACNGKNPVK